MRIVIAWIKKYIFHIKTKRGGGSAEYNFWMSLWSTIIWVVILWLGGFWRW